mmetsp:Transcript_14841/g.60643  ORF Transcript_14841/g.60643 Transcript_14841/m.60643 type:complete len:238 (+) Transcript_14841:1980-2693(+)
MEMSISRYPAATCTRYRKSICARITRDATVAEPPHSTYPAIAASCVATLHRRTLARYSTLIPMAMVHARAQIISHGVVSAAPRWRNATHGWFGSLHPANPSMYMDIGAMFLLQKPSGLGYASAAGDCEDDADWSATHQGTQSEQCPPEPKFSGQILFDPGWTHLATVPAAHPAGGSGTHACQQYTSPRAHDASSARTRLRLTFLPADEVEVSFSSAEVSRRSSPHAAAARTSSSSSS